MSARPLAWRPGHNALGCAALVFLAAPSTECGCSSRTTAGAGGAAATNAVVSVGTTGNPVSVPSSSSSSAGGSECVPPPVPSVVPSGWVADLEWACTCPFYVPGSKQALPSPIAWEKCPTVPQGVDCEAMHIDWSSAKIPVGFSPRLDHVPDGSTALEI